jgi:hypothetical protein
VATGVEEVLLWKMGVKHGGNADWAHQKWWNTVV